MRRSPAMLPLFLLLQVATPAATPDDGEVVVTARRRKCELSIADRVIKDREFRARAAEWAAGTPVRIVVGKGASYGCLARIVFKLGHYGVTRVVFDPPAPVPRAD